MERKELAEEIIDFCLEYKIKKLPNEISVAQSKVEEYLQYSWFVEDLILMLFVETRYIEKMDNNRLENLIAKLEKIRLDLEDGNGNE